MPLDLAAPIWLLPLFAVGPIAAFLGRLGNQPSQPATDARDVQDVENIGDLIVLADLKVRIARLERLAAWVDL